MGDGVNFSFNKGQKINITNFDGVSKDELLNREGISDSQKSLLQSIFNKYDNGDGILTADEYQAMQADLIATAGDDNLGGRELKRFNKNTLGADKNAYSMEDLQAVVGMMTDGTDSITGVKQNTAGEIEITYKPEEGGGLKTSYYKKGENNTLVLAADKIVNGDTTTMTDYVDGDRNKKFMSTETVKNGWTTSTFYNDDGVTPESITKTKGIETYTMDPQNPTRPLTYEKDGQPYKTTVVYSYDGDVTTETTYHDADFSKPVKQEVKGGENPSVTEYLYDGDVVTETTTVNGGEPTVVKKDKDGNVIPEPPTTTDYQVKSGEAWYNIVQAKYGVTDHKTIMNIVHQLKDAAGIDYKSTSIPSTITLPNEIKVGEQTFNLNIDAVPDVRALASSAPVRRLEGVQPNADAGNVVAVDPHPPVKQRAINMNYFPDSSARDFGTPPPVNFMPDTTKANSTQYISWLGHSGGAMAKYNAEGYITSIETLGNFSATYDISRDENGYMEDYTVTTKYPDPSVAGRTIERVDYYNADGTKQYGNDYRIYQLNPLTGVNEWITYIDNNNNVIKHYENDGHDNLRRCVVTDAQGNVQYYYNADHNFRNPDGSLQE